MQNQVQLPHLQLDQNILFLLSIQISQGYLVYAILAGCKICRIDASDMDTLLQQMALQRFT